MTNTNPSSTNSTRRLPLAAQVGFGTTVLFALLSVSSGAHADTGTTFEEGTERVISADSEIQAPVDSAAAPVAQVEEKEAVAPAQDSTATEGPQSVEECGTLVPPPNMGGAQVCQNATVTDQTAPAEDAVTVTDTMEDVDPMLPGDPSDEVPDLAKVGLYTEDVHLNGSVYTVDMSRVTLDSEKEQSLIVNINQSDGWSAVALSGSNGQSSFDMNTVALPGPAELVFTLVQGAEQYPLFSLNYQPPTNPGDTEEDPEIEIPQPPTVSFVPSVTTSGDGTATVTIRDMALSNIPDPNNEGGVLKDPRLVIEAVMSDGTTQVYEAPHPSVGEFSYQLFKGVPLPAGTEGTLYFSIREAGTTGLTERLSTTVNFTIVVDSDEDGDNVCRPGTIPANPNPGSPAGPGSPADPAQPGRGSDCKDEDKGSKKPEDSDKEKDEDKGPNKPEDSGPGATPDKGEDKEEDLGPLVPPTTSLIDGTVKIVNNDPRETQFFLEIIKDGERVAQDSFILKQGEPYEKHFPALLEGAEVYMTVVNRDYASAPGGPLIPSNTDKPKDSDSKPDKADEKDKDTKSKPHKGKDEDTKSVGGGSTDGGNTGGGTSDKVKDTPAVRTDAGVISIDVTDRAQQVLAGTVLDRAVVDNRKAVNDTSWINLAADPVNPAGLEALTYGKPAPDTSLAGDYIHFNHGLGVEAATTGGPSDGQLAVGLAALMALAGGAAAAVRRHSLASK